MKKSTRVIASVLILTMLLANYAPMMQTVYAAQLIEEETQALLDSFNSLLKDLPVSAGYSDSCGEDGSEDDFDDVPSADDFVIQNGVLVQYKGNGGAVQIPDSVTTIGASVFRNCTELTSIVLPDSVTSIGDYAFEGCTKLISVITPSSATSAEPITSATPATPAEPATSAEPSSSVSPNTIGKNAFAGCTSLTSVTIPKFINTISESAFSDCTALTSVTIPASVTAIGDNAFRECCRLTDITIPNAVTLIGNGAFFNCRSLTSLVIPDSVTAIGDNAFYDCGGLKSVTVPDSVTSIGSGAFFRCNSLTGIVIPSSVVSIGDEAFFVCSSLKDVTISSSVSSIGNHVFRACGSLTSVIIPDSVTAIGDYAFYDCGALTSVIIPDSVTSIGDSAFSSCNNLTDIYYTGSQEDWNTISISSNNTPLTNATIHYNYTPNGSVIDSGKCGDNITYTLYENGLLELNGSGDMYDYEMGMENSTPWEQYNDQVYKVEFKGAITSIGGFAFDYCVNLTDIIIPDTIKSIGMDALHGCGKLTNVTIPDSVVTIGHGAFENCSGLKSVIIPDSVTSIGGYAFGYCSRLTSVKIPNSVTVINQGVFEGCSSLIENPIHDNVTFISSLAFSGCSSLKSVSIPNTMTKIEWDTFAGCSSLADITIPDSVTEIDQRAFQNCSGLTHVTIPNSVTSIGNDAFKNCTGITNVTIPDSVTSMGSGVFSGCIGLESITISNSMTAIPWFAFLDCTALKKVTISDSVTEIGNQAFKNCKGLKSIIIPNSVILIDYGVFSSCNNLTDVYYKSSQEDWDQISIGRDNAPLTNATIHYNYTPNGSVIDSGKCGDNITYTLYENGLLELNGSGDMYNYDSSSNKAPWNSSKTSINKIQFDGNITSIGNYAFESCSSLTSITIPNSVISIGNSVLQNCSSLTSITIPNSITSIGVSALQNCSSLTSITIPNSVTSIHYNAFYQCSSLKSITIPNSVTYINDRAFDNCSSLTSINVSEGNNKYSSSDGILFDKNKTEVILCPDGKIGSIELPNSVISINQYAFCECSNLIDITLPNSVTSISNYAFGYCSSLTSFTIPDSITSIKDGAFCKCSSLTSITIPNSVTSIGEVAFYNCSSLTDVYYAGSQEDWNQISIDGYNIPLTNATIHYNCSNAYMVPSQIINVIATGDVTSIMLSWSMSSEVDTNTYCIYRRVDDGEFERIARLSDSRNTLNYKDTAVEENHMYAYYVTGETRYGVEGSASAITTACLGTDEEKPVVTKMTPAHNGFIKGSTSVTVTAQDNIGVSRVAASYSTDDGETWTSFGESESKPFTFTVNTKNLSDGKILVKAIAYDPAGNESDPLTYAYYVDNTGPEKVSGLSFISTSVTATLSWNDVADDDISYFRVEKKDSATGSYAKVTDVTKTLGANLYGLTPDTSYIYRVVGYDTHGNRGTPSDDITVQTQPDTTAPVITSINPKSGRYSKNISLSVTAKDEYSVAKIVLQLSCDEKETWQDIYTKEYSNVLSSATASYQLSLADYEEGYIYIRAVAYDKFGNVSDTSETAPSVQHLIDKTAPAAPQNVKAEGGNGYINVSWTPGTEEDLNLFSVYRSDAEDGTYTAVQTGLKTQNYIDRNVQEGKTYYYNYK